MLSAPPLLNVILVIVACEFAWDDLQNSSFPTEVIIPGRIDSYDIVIAFSNGDLSQAAALTQMNNVGATDFNSSF